MRWYLHSTVPSHGWVFVIHYSGEEGIVKYRNTNWAVWSGRINDAHNSEASGFLNSLVDFYCHLQAKALTANNAWTCILERVFHYHYKKWGWNCTNLNKNGTNINRAIILLILLLLFVHSYLFIYLLKYWVLSNRWWGVFKISCSCFCDTAAAWPGYTKCCRVPY